ncbi:MAG TPA: phospholipase D family protein [Verrucomicrobiae bacterium]|nr:phospholipase D family protein [Verrucomicrobiae bacterium]
MSGCASLPKPEADWNERPHLDTSRTAWARALAGPMAEHEGLSGVQLIPYGLDALSARLAVADTAERSLDVQYYIWKTDGAGRLLAEHLVEAADRGVKVRLLLDDVGGSTSDDLLLALDSHTNIEVRLFNPVANRLFRLASSLSDFQRVNRRMHNKSFTADKLVSIVGGRNIGDHYFASGEQEAHYADLDVIAAGPAGAEVSAMFDLYWFGSRTIPIRALDRTKLSQEQLVEAREMLMKTAKEISASDDFKGLAENSLGVAIRRREPGFMWGRTRLIYDLPEKVTVDRSDTKTHLLPKLRELAEGAEQELFVVSPYFVPGDGGVKFFRSLRARGTRVVVLANSLASNDVTPVHAGYSQYRKALLRDGVELFELKPTAQVRRAAREHDNVREKSSRSPGTGLHAKVFVFDRRRLFVGSFNLDPRSASLNTEMGLVIDIPGVAGPFAESLEKSFGENAYRLEFVPGPGQCKECGSIAWVSQKSGEVTRYTHDPETSFWRRLKVRCLRLLPIEEQL